ncbi:hypothetical protein AB1N83_013699, partial [Pleurotus pulmonarius]
MNQSIATCGRRIHEWSDRSHRARSEQFALCCFGFGRGSLERGRGRWKSGRVERRGSWHGLAEARPWPWPHSPFISSQASLTRFPFSLRSLSLNIRAREATIEHTRAQSSIHPHRHTKTITMPTTSASTNGSLSQSANTTPAREFQYKQQVQPSTATERTLSTSSDSSSTSSASSSSSPPPPTSTTSPAPISSDMLHHLALRMPFALHHPSSSTSSTSSSSSGSYTGSYYSSTTSSGSSSNRSSYVPSSPTITAFHTAPTSSHPAFASPPLHGPSPASRAPSPPSTSSATHPGALASPLARAHRAPPPADAPPLQIHSTPSKHTLC